MSGKGFQFVVVLPGCEPKEVFATNRLEAVDKCGVLSMSAGAWALRNNPGMTDSEKAKLKRDRHNMIKRERRARLSQMKENLRNGLTITGQKKHTPRDDHFSLTRRAYMREYMRQYRAAYGNRPLPYDKRNGETA